MQVYSGWHLLTARPSPEEEARVPHRLYGHIDPATRYSVGEWVRDVAGVLEEAREAGAVPVIVGGTGLYFTALTRGLSNVPPVPEGIREEAEARLARDGAAGFQRDLLSRDPSAAQLDIDNPRRMLRAWEVWEATGRSITDWARETPPPLLPRADIHAFVIEADRDALVQRIEARFDAMVAGGVMAEVAAMAARGLDPSLPAMRAVGAPPLLAQYRGGLSLEAAIVQAKTDTRRYAKRQRTWWRNQMGDWPRVPMPPDVQAVLGKIGA